MTSKITWQPTASEKLEWASAMCVDIYYKAFLCSAALPVLSEKEAACFKKLHSALKATLWAPCLAQLQGHLVCEGGERGGVG